MRGDGTRSAYGAGDRDRTGDIQLGNFSPRWVLGVAGSAKRGMNTGDLQQFAPLAIPCILLPIFRNRLRFVDVFVDEIHRG